MDDEIKFILDSSEEAMGKAIDFLDKQFANIRAGKANPRMLSSVKVDYYGSQTPLNQVGNVNAPDAQTLTIRPFEKSLIPEIEKAILAANLGFNPSNNGESVIINVPPQTEDRRRELVKQAKSEAEDAKVGVRNERKNANNAVKKLDLSEDLLHSVEEDIQELTDKYIDKIDKMLEAKDKEIMTV
ncbi:MAG TPA: ribosome recycling factor [Flavobacteriaceae bacterium]|nr:ribosome recycling factor [Flavobacteriaceae bacterium]